MWSGRTIWVGFDPTQGEWAFQDEQGHEIRRQAAAELSAKRIRALEVTNRRRGCHAAKPHEDRVASYFASPFPRRFSYGKIPGFARPRPPGVSWNERAYSPSQERT